jgi:nicotinamidase-related amidase
MDEDRLRAIVDPGHTAVVTMEVQRGTVGDAAVLPALADECARAGTVDVIARVCDGARAVGARVLHCTMEHRADGAGFVENCRIFAVTGRQRSPDGRRPLEIGSPGAELAAQRGPDPRDIVVPRLHGLTPVTSTPLDHLLRNVGASTVVATGVAVNRGIMGLVLNAVDLGYQVVLVRDAVAGVPADYAQSVIDNSLSMLATVVTADDLLALW